MMKLSEGNEYKFLAILGRIFGTVNSDVAANGSLKRQNNRGGWVMLDSRVSVLGSESRTMVVA